MVTLRRFNDTDAVALRAFRNTDMSVPEIQDMIREWNTLTCQGKYFEMLAILHEGELVGSVSLYQLSESVVSIGPEIFPAFQRHGFGKAAMRMAMEIAQRKGYRIVAQQVRKDNAASAAMHQSLGFETDGYCYQNKRDKEVLIYLKAL